MDSPTEDPRRGGFWPTALVLAAILGGLSLTRLYSYLLFHSLAEIFSIVVACTVFALFWNMRRYLEGGYFLFIGIAYLFVALLDLLHTLAYDKMVVFVGHDADLATQLWIAARYLESGSLLAAALLVRRKLNAGWVFAGFAAVVAALIWLIFVAGAFPQCFHQTTGLTTFKIASEYVICAMLLISGGLLFRRRQDFDPAVLGYLIGAIATTVAAELAFTLYQSPDSAPNLVGHLLKIVSFVLIYKAMIEVGLRRPFSLVFRELKASQEHLVEHQRRLREQVEAELAKAKEQLVRQTRLATIGRISASIVHELRNPLTVIRYAAHYLKRIAAEGDPEVNECLEQIESQVEATSRMIDNLMEMARSKESAKTEVDVGEIAARMLKQTPATDRPRLTTHFDPDPFVVWADPLQLHQVLGNLVANAAEAMEGKGEIRIRAWREDDSDVIVVEDDGPGIPDELRDEIFEPLVSGKPKGTGLGLAICRQIVQRHGGTIELRDGRKRGAAFQIRLPRPNSP